MSRETYTEAFNDIISVLVEKFSNFYLCQNLTDNLQKIKKHELYSTFGSLGFYILY
jgi:hypothetical protein